MSLPQKPSTALGHPEVGEGRVVVAEGGEASADRAGRLGIWAIPAAGLLIGAHWLFPQGTQTPEGIATYFTSPGMVILQEYVLLLGGLIVLLLGVVALSARLASLGERTAARVGLIFSVSGIALFLPVMAIPILVYPMLGHMYLSGHSEIATALEPFNPRNREPWLQAHLGVMLLVSVTGSIGMAVAIWRSRGGPRWASVLYALGFSLTLTDTPVIAWVGLILLIVASSSIALQSARSLPA